MLHAYIRTSVNICAAYVCKYEYVRESMSMYEYALVCMSMCEYLLCYLHFYHPLHNYLFWTQLQRCFHH